MRECPGGAALLGCGAAPENERLVAAVVRAVKAG